MPNRSRKLNGRFWLEEGDPLPTSCLQGPNYTFPRVYKQQIYIYIYIYIIYTQTLHVCHICQAYIAYMECLGYIGFRSVQPGPWAQWIVMVRRGHFSLNK